MVQEPGSKSENVIDSVGAEGQPKLSGGPSFTLGPNDSLDGKLT